MGLADSKLQVEIREIGLDQASLVQEIFASSPDYFRRTDRSEVLPHFAAREINDSVPAARQTPTYRKCFCLISVDRGDGSPIGIVDLHKDHPAKGQCYLGLLLIRGSEQKKNYGRLIFPYIEKFISHELGCSQIVLGVSEDNDVEGFWLKLGFKRNGRTYIWKGESHENQVFEMSKEIHRIE